MYDEDSYWIAGTRATKGKVEQKSTDDDTIRKLADFRGISTEMRNDYLSMRYTDFLHKYSMRYSKITGSEPVFDWYTDYEGNTYEMGKTNGQKVVWKYGCRTRTAYQKALTADPTIAFRKDADGKVYSSGRCKPHNSPTTTSTPTSFFMMPCCGV